MLQAASGDPRYPGSSREGIGARLSATVEWRVSNRAVAGVRLEGVRGEDFDEVRLQVYTRRWDSAITEPAREPPLAVLPAEFYEPELTPAPPSPSACAPAKNSSRYFRNRSPSSGWRSAYSTVASR